MYRKELEYVGWTILNHVGGQSHELTVKSRRTLALKSLNACMTDPMGGAIVERYIGFVFGRGVPTPAARDPEVQEIIETTWKHPANRRILTSPEKLAEKGRDLCIQNNVFFLYFDDGADGAVVMSLLKFDSVDHEVRDESDRLRILYYCAHERQTRYDVEQGTLVDVDTNGDPLKPKRVYYMALDGWDDHEEAPNAPAIRRG